MKVLVVHNPHSPDQDFFVHRDIRSLRDSGHQLIEYFRHTEPVSSVSVYHKLRAAGSAMWSLKTYREIRALILQHRPDVAFLYNTFPGISPSAYYACVDYEIPVVQGLRELNLFLPTRETTLHAASAGFWRTLARTIVVPQSLLTPTLAQTPAPATSTEYSARYVITRALRFMFQ